MASKAQEMMWTVFRGDQRWASGPPGDLAVKMKAVMNPGAEGPRETGLLVFDDRTGKVVDVDFRETDEEIRSRYSRAPESGQDEVSTLPSPSAGRKPGRPRLGVTSREVTLLPRHWDWLNEQPGGASVVLRKLVEAARTQGAAETQKRQSAEAAYRFMTTMAGDLPGYEEAIRALYAGDRGLFLKRVQDWPQDVRNYTEALASAAFAVPEETLTGV